MPSDPISPDLLHTRETELLLDDVPVRTYTTYSIEKSVGSHILFYFSVKVDRRCALSLIDFFAYL